MKPKPQRRGSIDSSRSSLDGDKVPQKAEFLHFLSVDKNIKHQQSRRKSSIAFAQDEIDSDSSDVDIEEDKNQNPQKRQRVDSIKGKFLANNLF